ncbi:MAG: ATP-dependent DNA helicase RecG [Candidatus Microgenomates bacterium]|jgi:ATP-dependent DNA helicase RecG
MDLISPITDLPKIGPIFARKFEKLGINTVEDLFYHVPSHYLDYSLVTTINKLHPGETATIHADIVSIKNIYSKRGLKMQIGSVEDQTGKITVIWFNQPFLIKTLYPGRLVSLSGKVGFFSRKLCLTSPDYEILSDNQKETVHTGRFVPIYPETSGLSSKWIRTKMRDAYSSVSNNIEDFLPEEILSKNKFVSLNDAIQQVHFPKNLEEAEAGRERLAFNELLGLELTSMHRKINWKKNKVVNKLKINQSIIKEFIEKIPFELTNSQRVAINEILTDMKKDIPMNRLLEGDVGSGKTVIAAVAAFAAFINGYQTVIMAPTQILAAQHYETFKKLLSPFNVRISLTTSDVKKSDLGRNDIFIGTHSLIQNKVIFDKVGLVIIDEQHRFGVEQRKYLVKKTGVPHVLTMTATPIPRTIALTSFGDLDLSVLMEMPKGRIKIATWVVPEKKRKSAYDWLKTQIKKLNSQIFIVCPLIEDSDAETLEDVKSVTTEFEKLKKIFTGQKLGLLHGRLKPTEKDKILNDFRKRRIDILVTTPVVEVGIDIPNATVMVIEAAERFGLAQLHQLRGRVGRGNVKSYCLLFSNFHSGTAFQRLKAMEKSNSGFELAELDLKLRGPGEIFGTAQSGFPELKIASWNNYELIKKARDVATDIIKNPKKYPAVKENLTDSKIIN